MLDNTGLLQQMFSQGQVALENAAFIKNAPAPLPAEWDYERVEGMLLGLAIGDSLGNTTESQLPTSRVQTHGEIRDYLPNRHAGNRPVGVPSDDSQMAFWTLEQLLEDGGLVPERLAEKFTRNQIFGIGSTVKEFLRAYKDQGLPWQQAGQPSAGNGSLMRIAPLIIPHLRQPTPALWADAALAGLLTHNDRASNACCVAFTNLLWQCLLLKDIPAPHWWIDTFVSVAREVEGPTDYATRTPASSYTGPLWKFVDQEVRAALRQGSSTLEACNRWYSGAYLLETMPSVLYILAKYGHQPEEAIVRAVNDTKDNDTVAAIVGAAVGAMHGRTGLPERWVSGLLGRTGADNDWHIFELIEEAKQTFWKSDPPLSQVNILAVLEFLPIFEQSNFSAGEWKSEEGVFPHYNYSEIVLRFEQALYNNEFIQPFNWSIWEEGKRLVDHPELLQRANLQTLRKLLTAHVRAERFSDGHLAAMFESGHIHRILKRMKEISDAKPNNDK